MGLSRGQCPTLMTTSPLLGFDTRCTGPNRKGIICALFTGARGVGGGGWEGWPKRRWGPCGEGTGRAT